MKKVIIITILVFASLIIYNNLDDPIGENNNLPEEEGQDEVADPVEREVKGKVAIIIDDLGYYPELNKELLKVEEPLTLAILPFLQDTEKAVDDFRSVTNFELILHMPLEPMGQDHFEEKMIMTHHSKAEMDQLLTAALLEMKGAVAGVNNHKGSKFTSDREKMRDLLELIKREDLFFIDSYTINTSVGYDLAKEISVPTEKRDLFLDNVDQKEAIRNSLYELEELALERGWAIAIGHHKENTIRVLQEELPKMRERGIKLVKVSELLN